MAGADDQVLEETFAREEAEYQAAIDASAYEGTDTPPAESSLPMLLSGASQALASASAAYSPAAHTYSVTGHAPAPTHSTGVSHVTSSASAACSPAAHTSSVPGQAPVTHCQAPGHPGVTQSFPQSAQACAIEVPSFVRSAHADTHDDEQKDVTLSPGAFAICGAVGA